MGMELSPRVEDLSDLKRNVYIGHVFKGHSTITRNNI